jgi:hypothetical protein
MKKLFAAAALLSLAACATAGSGGPRTDWLCDNGAAYSVRIAANGAAEVFAGGRIYTLPASGGRYSDGQVTYSDDGALAGAHGGPYTNCRRG